MKHLFIEELNEFLAERMDKPLQELEKQDFFQDRKKVKDQLYETLYNILKTKNKEHGNDFEKLMGEVDTLSSYNENVYYMAGVLDGMRFRSVF